MSSRKQEIIVVLSHLPWDFPCDYLKQTSLELARKARVIIFSPIVLPTIRQLIFRNKELISGGEGVDYFPSVGILPFQRFGLIRRINLLLNFLIFFMFYLVKYGGKKPVFWGFSHSLTEVLPFLFWGRALVYDRVDQPASISAKEDMAIKKQDQKLLSKADFVFTNSPYALRYIKKYNQQSFLVPCGCDISLFEKRKVVVPKELVKIGKPIIGLTGSIDHRLDFKIIYPLAKKRKDWNFVFIGSPFSNQKDQLEKADFYSWVERLKKLSNVYFLGQKPKGQMANFIAGFDVCLIPYDISQEFVRGGNPMKLFEYLAMGKPVVSTPIEAVEQYSSKVKIAESVLSFESAIKNFLEKRENQREVLKRKKIAKENSWQEKTEKMWRHI